MNAVAAGLRANINHRVADAFGLPVKHLVLAENTQGERVHQRIAVVAFFKDALAADGRDAEAVAIVRDPRDNAFENAAIARNIERAEAYRVQHGDGPRAHGENIAQDAADAGGRALERFDEARMVVRFDLECDRVASADINDARVLARTLQHQFATRGELLQMNARTLIRAMFAPHHAEDAELGVGGLAAEQGDNLVVFRPGELVGFDNLWRHSLVFCR